MPSCIPPTNGTLPSGAVYWNHSSAARAGRPSTGTKPRHSAYIKENQSIFVDKTVIELLEELYHVPSATRPPGISSSCGSSPEIRRFIKSCWRCPARVGLAQAVLLRGGKADGAQDLGVGGVLRLVEPGGVKVNEDPRADIYSIGILINVMLTGEHPSAKQAEGALGRVVERCTHVNPDKRYKNVLRLQPGGCKGMWGSGIPRSPRRSDRASGPG